MNAKRQKREAQWTPGKDYRVICSCQRHSGNGRQVVRRSLRIVSRGVALLVGVPLAFAAFDFPVIEAVGLSAPALRAQPLARPPQSVAPAVAALPIFTSPAVKEAVLAESPAPQALSLDVVKEHFFATQVPYGSIIYREARRNNLPPELVAAIVQTESDFRVGLVSHKSAQGLMQIVPETARLLGVRDPFDPQQNIAGGTRYLRHLMNRFPSQRLALAAYNAGETRVARIGDVPDFAETKNYIERVNRRTSQFRRRVNSRYVTASRLRPTS